MQERVWNRTAVCVLAFIIGFGTGVPAAADEPTIESIGEVKSPMGICMDGRGFVYVPDGYNHVIWWGSSTQKFSMYIGEVDYGHLPTGDPTGFTPVGGYLGDGKDVFAQGNVVRFRSPTAVFVDRRGEVYIADSGNNVIRKIDGTGVISTVAGKQTGTTTAVGGFSGDGGRDTQAIFDGTTGVFVDGSGIIYIVDQKNLRVRMVDNTRTVKTVVGNGTAAFSGDGGPATSGSLNYPWAVLKDSRGNLCISDTGNHRIRKVDASGTITTIAGNGTKGFSGDGSSAVSASLDSPLGIFLDSSGALYIADKGNHRIRKVDSKGVISTVTGNGTAGLSGEGGPATGASLNVPSGVFVDSKGDLYIADRENNRIRLVRGIAAPTIMGRAAVSLAAHEVVFDPTSPGQTSERTMTLTNIGMERLEIKGCRVTGTDASDFKVPSATGVFESGESLTVRVTFGPASEGEKSATLWVDHNAGGSSMVKLSGVSELGLKISLASSVSFDAVEMGKSSQRTLTINNPGGEALTVKGITVDGTDASQFEVSPTSATIEPGGSQTITVTFSPTSMGSKSASLRVEHSAGEATTVNVSGGVLAVGRSADFDGKGAVDLEDFFQFAAAFGQSAGGDNARFDLDGNNAIDLDDFFIFASLFGKQME